MVLDSKFKLLVDHFGILDPEDWQAIRPAEISAVPSIGSSTLNHLRVMLANRGLTLLEDRTPEHWQAELGLKRGATEISQTDNAIVSEFRILIDTREQNPFTFMGIKADARQGGKPILVATERTTLGESHGDYTVPELIDYCHVERKSREDAWGTVLGWGDRREAFQRTLEYLAEIPVGLVVVEATWGDCLNNMPEHGTRTKSSNQKIFNRQVLAWGQDYGVQWHFFDDRRLAEVNTFRILERQWRKQKEAQKRAQKEASETDYEL
jgi:hypothetical protein